MDRVISCCGVICSECAYFPGECPGCPAIRGRVFWLEYTGGQVCDIYRCCVENKGRAHCGGCPQLPCAFYEQDDPTKSPEENAADFQKQLKHLQEMERHP